MRTTGNSLIIPEAIARKKNVSAFKTISFLVSFPENETGINCSDSLSGKVGNPADVHEMRGDLSCEGCFYGDIDSEHSPQLLNDKDTFPGEMNPAEITLTPVSYPSSGEKDGTALSPQGDSCSDIHHKKDDFVHYPGRSVLFSRQFHPLDRIIRTE